MKEIIKIVINLQLPHLNYVVKKAKRHWGGYSADKKKYTLLVSNLAKKYLPQLFEKDGTIAYTTAILFEWYTKDKRVDADNIAFAKKFILDGFEAANIIAGDGRSIVDGFIDTFKIDKQNPRVEVTFYKLEDFLNLINQIKNGE